jgi:xanthine/CO dehydrogenase XdhC/CoxF family maturation factor
VTSLTDISAMLAVWSGDDSSDRRAALATVVYVKGSAYRRPGARMLVTAAGRSAGMISGGCLEDDVREHARQVMATGEPRVVTYDTTSPSDIVFGLGLGCSGVVKVLIEPLGASDGCDLLTFLAVCHDRRQTGRIATIFSSENDIAPVKPGARLLRWPDGNVTTNFDDPALRSRLLGTMDDTTGRRAAIRQLPCAEGGRMGVLLETIAPPTSLLLFGAGDDAVPVAQLAKQIGWHITVIDGRPDYAKPGRFPSADAVLCLRAEMLANHPQVNLTPQSVAMILTHSFTRDKELLRALLPRRLRYVGILGPRVRTQRLLDELAMDGVTFPGDMLDRLHGPAGLDISAETPEEIALSIIAEIRAVLGRREGASLRLRTGAIHEPIDETVAAP